ncbi:hypothetical protein ABZ801_12560 [Actinomadura sp. NPDC047616]|uniref:hypothetical protein n=1 Tax=Actinomadura sp. NPDC047616 TaxID=3155914 RepID=UPI0033CF32FD
MQIDDPAMERLRRDFPGHHIWRSKRWDGAPGEYVATLIDPTAGVDATVMQPNPTALRKALNAEAKRARAKGNGR